MSPRLAADSQTPQRLKMIESSIEEKAPKMYRELRKSGGLKKFVEDVDKNLLDSYEDNLIMANQKMLLPNDPLDYLPNVAEVERRVWAEALETWLEFSDVPEESTTELIPQTSPDLEAGMKLQKPRVAAAHGQRRIG